VSAQVDLSNEVALVTGGSRNIGLAIARALQAAGARVCVWGRADQAALEAALSDLDGAGAPPAAGRLVDVSDEAAVIAGFDAVETELGPLTILINNAARRPYGRLEDLEARDWAAVIDVILTGAFLTSRELFRRLPDGRAAAIVNIGGLSAHRPAQNRPHVIAAKAGLEGLTRSLAADGLGRIRANCVVPGAIEVERPEGHVPPRFLDEAGFPKGSPEDVARAVVPLADPKAQYVTGQTLHVSGGRFMP
jgi:3-oxoacyl-[acyl-carrier protein] reductase